MPGPDPDSYEAIARHGRPALAWEVLRRDPTYQAAVAGLATVRGIEVAADPAFVADWGLHFR